MAPSGAFEGNDLYLQEQAMALGDSARVVRSAEGTVRWRDPGIRAFERHEFGSLADFMKAATKYREALRDADEPTS